VKRVVAVSCALAVLGVLGAGGPAPASGSHPPVRPDLTVSNGAVTLTGSTLSGSFSVKDKGAVKAKKTWASLYVRVAGQDQFVASIKVKAIGSRKSRKVSVSVAEPAGLPAGSLPVSVCADSRHKLKERSEQNNCRTIGSIVISSTGPSGPPSSVPANPVPYTKNVPFTLTDAESSYWVYVPTAYDASHQTPMTLFVWLHGCGGSSAGDIYSVSPGGAGQDWISVTVGGQDGNCWNMNSDPAKVLAAIADLKTHFNINPRRVIVGGYNSGASLAYRTAFDNAHTFAGVLAENSTPFRDTGSSSSALMAGAAWKFNVAHLAHLEDATYPIAGVETETDAMTHAGFPVYRIEREGGLFDNPGDVVNGHPVPGTLADLATYLFPFLDAGWLSPA
jgi:hypothetical protein